MREWIHCTWGDVATLEYGKSLSGYREAAGSVPVYGTNGKIGWTDEPLYDSPGVIIGRKGAYRGVHYSSAPFFVIDTAFYLKPLPDKDFDPKWAYYHLLTQDINLMDSGSAIPSTSRGDFYALDVFLPPIDEQFTISSFLTSFDDKIEANRRMNATLEATTRALFKSWFVDFDPVHAKSGGEQPAGMDAATAALFPDHFEDSELGPIPAGWGVGRLDDVTEFVIGGDWGKTERANSETKPVYCIRGADIPSLQQGGLGAMPVRYIKPSSLKKRSLKEGDIVIEISGGSPTQQTGRVVLATEVLLSRLDLPLSFSNFCRLVRTQRNVSSKYVYLWMNWLYDSELFYQYESGTTGIKNFAFTTFSSQFPLLIPPQEILDYFENTITVFFEKHQTNGIESETLAETRDALLPRLVSGEVRVGEM